MVRGVDRPVALTFPPAMKSLALLAVCALAMISPASADESKLAAIPLKDIDGKATSLQAYQGKALLIVNVASKCGFTKQYEGLEAVWRKYKDQGLVVLGFPSNDFGSQEPGTNEEIKQFCSSKFGVTFPMFDKLHVKGAEQHPLYTALTGKSSPVPGDVKWNFGKFLIGKDGKILKRWDSKTEPGDKELTEAVEAALAAK